VLFFGWQQLMVKALMHVLLENDKSWKVRESVIIHNTDTVFISIKIGKL